MAERRSATTGEPTYNIIDNNSTNMIRHIITLDYYVIYASTIIYIIGTEVGWTERCLYFVVGATLFFIVGFRKYSSYMVEKEIKSLLEYDFGRNYEVITCETKWGREYTYKKEWYTHFVVRLPQDAMDGVKDFCNSTETGESISQKKRVTIECTTEGYNKYIEYISKRIIECDRLEINFIDNTISYYSKIRK